MNTPKIDQTDKSTDYDTPNDTVGVLSAAFIKLSAETANLRAENERMHQRTHELVFHAGCYAAFSAGVLLAFVINEYIR